MLRLFRSSPEMLPGQSARLALIALLMTAPLLPAQVTTQPVEPQSAFIRTNTFGFFFAYSNDSSHILMGSVQGRKLLNVGATYGRRIWAGKVVNWQYHGEIMPVALESDPTETQYITITGPNNITGENQFSFEPNGNCSPGNAQSSYSFEGVVYSVSTVTTCSRRWTIGESLMPVGFEWNFLPHHRIQPFLVGHGGYMYSTSAIPVENAGNFNFAFDFGAGVEIFRSHKRSVRIDYRYHHISNHDTANQNPGIDNGLAEITYCFGK